MISGLLGRAGSGKSYEATRRVRDELKTGRVVITTLPLVADAEYWSPFLESGQLVIHPYRGDGGAYGSDPAHWDEWREPRHQREVNGVLIGPLVVLDEVVFIWSELGPKDNVKNPKWAHVEQIIATHRHSAIDFLWVAQTHLQMPTEVKKQVEEWIELQNMAKVGVKTGYSWASYTTWYPPRERLDGGVRFYNKDVFALYDTHALGSAAGSSGGERKRFFSNRPIWTRGFFWLGVAAVGLMVYVLPGFVGLIGKWFGEEGFQSENAGSFSGPAPAEAKVAEPPPGQATPSGGSKVAPGERKKGPELPPEYEGFPGDDVALRRITGRRVVWADGTSMTWPELTVEGVFVLERRPCLLRVRRIGVGTLVWRCRRLAPGGESEG